MRPDAQGSTGGGSHRSDSPLGQCCLRDAVGSKIAAAFSRGEVRDVLDADSIHQSAHFTDAELLRLAQEHDAGFDRRMLAAQLDRFAHMSPARPTSTGSPTTPTTRSPIGFERGFGTKRRRMTTCTSRGHRVVHPD